MSWGIKTGQTNEMGKRVIWEKGHTGKHEIKERNKERKKRS